jgi:hypothetical protein
MPRGEHFLSRRTALLVVLCFTLLGQWCAYHAEHEQHSSTEHCCLLCHIGPHATLDAVAPVTVAPSDAAVWFAPPAEAATPREAPAASRTSRGPPFPVLS